MYKQISSVSFKNHITNKLFVDKSYNSIYMCKQDLAFNYPQVLICHKTQPIKYEFSSL